MLRNWDSENFNLEEESLSSRYALRVRSGIMEGLPHRMVMCFMLLGLFLFCPLGCGPRQDDDWVWFITTRSGNSLSPILRNVLRQVDKRSNETTLPLLAKRFLRDCNRKIICTRVSLDSGYGKDGFAPTGDLRLCRDIRILYVGSDGKKISVLGNIRPPPGLGTFILYEQSFPGFWYYEVKLADCNKSDRRRIELLSKEIFDASSLPSLAGNASLDGARVYCIKTITPGMQSVSIGVNPKVEWLGEDQDLIDERLNAIGEIFSVSWEISIRDTAIRVLERYTKPATQPGSVPSKK